MSVLKPNYAVEIGSETFEPKSGIIISIYVSLSMNVPAGFFELFLSLRDKSLKVKRDEEVSIKIGYEDDLQEVFTGYVENIEPTITGLRITGFNAASKLLEMRTNQVYEQQSAKEIVSDLAKKASVQIEELSDGISLPMYVVVDSKNSHDHIRELAEKCGFDIYVTSGNKLVFKKYESKKPHVLKYGKNIIGVESFDWKAPFKSVTVHGEGAASYKGADTAHWLTKKQVEGIAGSGMNLFLLDPVVRDKDTAEKVAKAKLDVISKATFGTVKVIGDAKVKLGDTIKIEDMKDDRLNKEFQVRAVEHILNKIEGFITLIGWRI